MDSTELKDYLMNALCRICAEKSAKLIPIFEMKLLPVKICKCLPIKVTVEDQLPVKICEVCLSKIDESFLLYETCYYADQKLKKLCNMLEKETIVHEPEIFINESIRSEEVLIAEHSISKDYFINVNKKDSDDMNNANASNQTLENRNFQLKNQTDDMISSDIINITDEMEHNNLNFLNSIKYEIISCSSSNLLNNLKMDLLLKRDYSNDEIPKSKNKNDVQSGIEVVQEKPTTNGNTLLAENEKEDITEIYKCHFCSEQFASLTNLNNHELTHAQVKSFLCDTCGKSFKHAKNLKNHIKIHSSHRKKYICKICNKSYFTNFFLQEHMNVHTGETPYKCSICEKEFREKVHLRQHKWTHSSEKFLCPICGNHFNRKGNMTEHIKKYHSSNEKEKSENNKSNVKKSSEIKFSCASCKKTFSNQNLLKNHEKRHLKKQLYFCSFCDKQFRHSGSLTYHRRTAHTGEKPFQCNYCEEKFSLRSIQRIHERKMHTFEYPYKCLFCSRVFNNSSSLKNHSYVHVKEKMFECDQCGKKFSRNSNLFVHKKIHSDDRQYICEHCGKSYIQKHDMIKHKKVHDPKSKPFFCKYCAHSFSHKKDFARHAVCQFDYIRKSNSDKSTNAEKILEIFTGHLKKFPKTLFDAETLISETSQVLTEEILQQTNETLK